MTTEAPERPRTIEVTLAGQKVTVTRLRTRAGLIVAKILLGYIAELREPLLGAAQNADLLKEKKGETSEEKEQRSQKVMEVAADMLAAVNRVLKDDDFLKVISLLLGQPIDAVAEAPLEETMNAIADAFSINDMPLLLKGANRIWQEIQNMGVTL